MDYLLKYELETSDIEILEKNLDGSIKEQIILFNNIITENLNYILSLGVNNTKDIFMGHTHMFLKNPDKFKNIFDKYDRQDLIRCLEKNASIIEKL